ncbi:unnamed protein product, partial [Polarella glacialis]
ALPALLEDLSGQVAEAFSKEEWYAKWGSHYLPSLLCAHRSQQCNNFKDPGVQHYGGNLFGTLRDQADEVFCNLEAPVPVPRAAVAAPAAAAPRGLFARAVSPEAAPAAAVSMAAYYDRYAGCIDGLSRVHLADGSRRRMVDVVKGDLLESLGPASPAGPQGAAAEVLCVVRTVAPLGRFRLVQLPEGGPRVTPYHPVLSDGAWRFPSDLAAVEELECDSVFTFVLADGAAAFVVEGVSCVSLGHGLQEGVARHPYLGSPKVLEDLSRFPGFRSGLVDLPSESVIRDETGLICGLRPSRI